MNEKVFVGFMVFGAFLSLSVLQGCGADISTEIYIPPGVNGSVEQSDGGVDGRTNIIILDEVDGGVDDQEVVEAEGATETSGADEVGLDAPEAEELGAGGSSGAEETGSGGSSSEDAVGAGGTGGNSVPAVVSTDVDGDGYSLALGDCNDNNPAIHPGATETTADAVDYDCDGSLDPTAVPDLRTVTIRFVEAKGITPTVYADNTNLLTVLNWVEAGGFYESAPILRRLAPKMFYIAWPYNGVCSWWWEANGSSFCGESSFQDGVCKGDANAVKVVNEDGTLDDVVLAIKDGFTCRRVNNSI
jgi:hypothetical protein